MSQVTTGPVFTEETSEGLFNALNVAHVAAVEGRAATREEAKYMHNAILACLPVPSSGTLVLSPKREGPPEGGPPFDAGDPD